MAGSPIRYLLCRHQKWRGGRLHQGDFLRRLHIGRYLAGTGCQREWWTKPEVNCQRHNGYQQRSTFNVQRSTVLQHRWSEGRCRLQGSGYQERRQACSRST